jgi:hypothetical protein
MKHVLRFFTHTALLRTTLSDLRSSKAQNRVPILRFFLPPPDLNQKLNVLTNFS